MTFTKKILAAATILAASTGAMASGLVGDTLTYQYLFPTASDVYESSTFVVGNGVEVADMAGYLGSIDVSADQIVIDFAYGPSQFTATAFNGILLTSATSDVFGAVTVDAATSTPGFSSSFLSTTGRSVSINWENMPFTAGDKIVLDVASPVPEADTTAMLAAGLFVLAGVARRRRSN